MKITRLETFHVRPRWLLLKLHTDAGIHGWGEPLVEGRAKTVETAVHEIGRTLVGEDPRQIEKIWQRYYRGTFYRGGPVLTSALSGIEQALWDILGKSLNAPVYQLLGGKVRDKIRLYGWLDVSEAGDYVQQAARKITDLSRFSAYKFVPLGASEALETPARIEQVVDTVATLRAKLGPDTDMALDFHGRASPALAKQLCRKLEPFNPMFIEEPVLPTNPDALKEISRSTTIPIAAGERLYTRWDFWNLINDQAVAVIQPDLSHVGGILEARKIAAMAEVRDIAFAPHCPLGPVALAACLQVDACTPNFLCQEHFTLGEELLHEPFKVVDGCIQLTDRPGLGIELDEEKLYQHRHDGNWETPQFRRKDGSFCEW